MQELVQKEQRKGIPATETIGRVLYETPFAPDQESSMKSSSPLVFLKCIPAYEHLCLLWADRNPVEVVPDVLRCLSQYSL